MIKNKFFTLIWFCVVCVTGIASAQSKKTVYEITAEGLVSGQQSVFRSGSGVRAAALWPLSPSFNLGGSLSYETIKARSINADFNPASARVAAMYFPEALLKSIINDKKILPGFYFRGEIGHHVSNDPFTEKTLFNNYSISAGYWIPVRKNAVSLQVGLSTFYLNSNFTTTQQINSGLYAFSIGYTFIKLHK